MPLHITAPARVPVPGGKIIDEHVGAVNTPATSLGASVSVAHMDAPAHWVEPYQSPEFDEITLVLSGSVLLDHAGGQLEVKAGESVITYAGERIRYSTGEQGAQYVAVCLPAFAPETVNREDEQP